MSSVSLPKYAIVDDFLPDVDAQDLLDHALANAAIFDRASTVVDGALRYTEEQRKAVTTEDLGPPRAIFCAAVEAHFEHLCKAVGLQPFPIVAWDVELAAHRDGGFFHEHIDTMTAQNRDGYPGDRVISLVYYLHRQPASFDGGDLLLKPFAGDTPPARIAPRHNRLVAFPSFARHEVEPVQVPGDAWEDARFAINCWLLRGRG